MGSPYLHFDCGFVPYLPVAGPVGMISQSGANLVAALGASQNLHLGMSFFVGLGNKADVDFSEFILYGKEDPTHKCIATYIEGLDSPEAYIQACRATVPEKTGRYHQGRRFKNRRQGGIRPHGVGKRGHGRRLLRRDL
jgi:acyl-CoA synthetase (NDP forming)